MNSLKRLLTKYFGIHFHKWSEPETGEDGRLWRDCTEKDCCEKQRFEMCGASDTMRWRYK